MNEPSLDPFLLADVGGIVFLPFALAGIAFWVLMLADCANHEKEGSTKIAWLLIILFVGIVGAPLYFFVRKLPRQRLAQYHAANGLVRPWRRRNFYRAVDR
jgi:hypothetical protein